MSSTLRSLAEALGVALLPLVEATDDAELAVDFLRRLGWDVTTAPGSFMALQGPLSLAFDNAVGGDDGIEVDRGVLIPSVLLAWRAVEALAASADLPPAMRAELPGQLVDALLVGQLRSHFPGWHAVFDALGIVGEDSVTAAPGRLPYLRQVFDREKLLEYIDAPLESLKATYRWGDAAFDTARMTRAAVAMARALGARVDRHAPPAAVVSALGTAPTGPRVVLVERRGIPLVVGLALLQVPATPMALPGFAVVPTASAPVGGSIGLFDGRVTIQGDVATGVGVAVRAGQPPQVVAGAGFRVAYERLPEETTLLLGDEGGTRIEARGGTAVVEVSGTVGDLQMTAEIAARNLAVVLDGGDADGFVGAALPRGLSQIEFPMALAWSTKAGISVSGSPRLATTVPVTRRFGPTEVTAVSVELRNGRSNDGAPALALDVGTTLCGAIGPVAFVVEGAGVAFGLALCAGNLGPLDVTVGFKAPDGAGLAITAGPVRGGGYLRHTAGRYAGALALDALGISLSATGLLDATGAGYSLVATIGAEFPAVPLPLGFTLEGVGGLIAIHRRVDTDALRASLRTPAGMGDIFFPAAPVAQAARITTDLATYFPAAEGRHVFGPAVKFGWGTPTMIRGELAVLLELPAPARVVLLGTVSAKLPTVDHAIVDLNVDVVGEVDFAQKRVAVDASLRNSTIAGFPITGDMAFRMAWGSPPSFALAIGGFHSQFPTPPGFPELRRVQIPLGAGDDPRLDAQGFLALTSNTAQIGARIDLYASAGPLNIKGSLGFETLLTFSPFQLQVDVWAGVALRRGTSTLASIHFDGHLSGPKPWRLDGKACLSLWFVDLCVPIHVSFGADQTAELPRRQIWPALHEALATPAAWASAVPPGLAAAVTAPASGEAPAPRLEPCATLTVTQKVVPLDRQITAFAHGRPDGVDRFQVTGVRFGTTAVPAQEIASVTEWFAPAQFEEMSEADKLSRPGFEQMVGGVSIGATTIRAGAPLVRALDYDTVVIVDGQRQEPPRYRPTRDLQLEVTLAAASARPPLRATGPAAFAPPEGRPPRLRLVEETFVIASTDELALRWDLAAAGTRGQVELALRAHLAAHPGDAGRLQVVPTFEVAA